MRVTYNAHFQSAYVRVSRARVAASLPVHKSLVLDLDRKNRVVGIEILDIAEPDRISLRVIDILAGQGRNND